MQVHATAIGWYSRQDYPRILEIMSDSEKLPAKYDNWLRTAEASEKHMGRQGMKVFRAIIQPEEFLAWCNANSLKTDADARIRWSNEWAYRQIMAKTQ